MSGYQSYLRALGYTHDEAFRIGQLVDGDEIPPLSDLTADIGDALAAEEHRQGLAYGDDADHCEGCAIEARRRQQAECEHAVVHTADMTMIDQPRRDLLATCGYCGLSWREEGEWL